jgi:hypothetical protein
LHGFRRIKQQPNRDRSIVDRTLDLLISGVSTKASGATTMPSRLENIKKSETYTRKDKPPEIHLITFLLHAVISVSHPRITQ